MQEQESFVSVKNQFEYIDPKRWWETPQERIPVVERDPATVRLMPGHAIVKRIYEPEKVGRIFVPDGNRRPTKRCELVRAAPLRKKDEPIPQGATVHIHGHARGQIRLKWDDEVYDLILREDIEAVEVEHGRD